MSRTHTQPPLTALQSPKAIVLAQANREMPEPQGEPKRVDAVAKEILDAGYSNMRKALE